MSPLFAWLALSLSLGVSGTSLVVVESTRLTENDQTRLLSLLVVGLCGVGASLVLLLATRFSGGTRSLREAAELAELRHGAARALEARGRERAFFAQTSHEIRTSMNGVMGMLELFAHTDLDARQRRYLSTLQAAARSLLTLLDDILDLSKLEAGKLELRPDTCRVRELVEEVTELFGARAELRGLRLLAEVDAAVPSHAVVDAQRLRQILSNLLANALKVTERGGVTVRVAVAEEPGSSAALRFEVSDTGPGIEPSARPRLFEAFSQLAHSPAAAAGGTGLGLAICRQLVDVMNGRIGVESELGTGSTFWFVVPARGLDAIDSIRPGSARSLALRPSQPSSRFGQRVLVAEDDAVSREVIVELLQHLGYEVSVVANGLEALAALERESYALVLMDCEMPGLDGCATAQEIRRRKLGGAHVPLIAVTAHASASDRERILARGMDDVLTKPISSARLDALLRRWWRPEPASGEQLASSRVAAARDLLQALPAGERSGRPSQEVAKIFLKYVPRQLEALAQALARGEPAALRCAAHKLKGSCLAVGVTEMAELSSRLESGDGDAAVLLVELQAAFERAERELSAELAAAATSRAN